MPTKIPVMKRKQRLELGPMLLASTITITVVWIGIFLNEDNLMENLSQVSASVRSFSHSPGLLIAVGFTASLFSVFLTTILLVRAVNYFLAIWLFTLAISEASLPVIQQISLALRYSMMVSLILAGVFYLASPKYRINGLQKISLLTIAWISLELLINPADTNALLMMPMQITIFVGVLIGLSGMLQNNTISRKIAYALVIASVVSVLINAASIVLLNSAFVAGRFRSWYPLPTNFANIFVLGITPLLWAAFDSRRIMLKLCLIALCLLSAALIMLSGTRNAILVLALSIFQMTIFWKRRYIPHLLIISIIVGLLFMLFSVNVSDLGSVGARISQISENEVRFGVWERAINDISHHPLIGYGLSNDLGAIDKNLELWERFNAHNAILGLWIRMGIVGVLMHLAIYFISLFSGFTALIKGKHTEKEVSILVLFCCILLNLFVAGLTEENLTSRASLPQGMWALAVVMIALELKNLRYLARQKAQLRHTAAKQLSATNTPLDLTSSKKISL